MWQRRALSHRGGRAAAAGGLRSAAPGLAAKVCGWKIPLACTTALSWVSHTSTAPHRAPSTLLRRCQDPGQRPLSSVALYPAPREDVQWDTMGFRLATRDTGMVVANCHAGHRWGECRVEPYGPLALEPAATVLNYGQGIFEGIKAYRTTKNRIVLFRPQKNAQRMAGGARRMLMPPVPSQLFLEACSLAVKENAEWVPPCGEGALYLRPLLFGSGSDLGVKPSSAYTFLIYVSPVGQYFGPGTMGVRMKLCNDHQRAAPAGVGDVKAIGNYAQCFSAQLEAKGDGFSDIIYLDVSGEYIDEAAASNFFCVDHDRVIHTPQLGTILPGVTRDTIIQLARGLQDTDVHLQVGRVSAATALKCTEAFLTGTGAGITPVAHISSDEESADLPHPGPITQMLQKMLADIQLERVSDPSQWLHDPFVEPSFGRDSLWEAAF